MKKIIYFLLCILVALFLLFPIDGHAWDDTVALVGDKEYASL